MQTLPIRLNPGQDLRSAIEAAVRGANCRAAFVLSGIGSLSSAGLRFAGAEQPRRLTGDMEILSLSGTVAFNGTSEGARSSSHLHMALSTATGEVLGGHVAPGCTVRTTAEVLLALLPEWEFSRAPDAATGYDELAVRAVEAAKGDLSPGDQVRAGLGRLGVQGEDVADAGWRGRAKRHRREPWICYLICSCLRFPTKG